MTELPDMSAQSTRRLYELMFEYFEVQSLYVANAAEMAIVALGLETGVVVDVSAAVVSLRDVTSVCARAQIGNRMQVVPIVAGARLPHATLQLRVGAGNLNDYLARLITEHGNYFDPLVDVEALGAIKAQLCCVSLDASKDAARSELEQTRSCVLGDGKKVTVGSEAWRCAEGLFDPHLMGLDIPGVHQNVFAVIQKSPVDLRNQLFAHIVLAGGSTLFRNFPGTCVYAGIVCACV
jgi:actin-related protein 2